MNISGNTILPSFLFLFGSVFATLAFTLLLFVIKFMFLHRYNIDVEFCGPIGLQYFAIMSFLETPIMTTFNDTVRARIDHNVKETAEDVLKTIGMDMSDAIRLFVTQIANRKEFPIELRVPNQTTIDAMNADVEPETYESAEALFSEILSNAND